MRTAAMYRILDDAGINIIRVGLKSSDIINGEDITSGTFHPAFRQLVEGTIAREDLYSQLKKYPPDTSVLCVSNPGSFNNMIGHKAANKAYFKTAFPNMQISFASDQTLKKGFYSVKTKKEI